MFVSKAYFRLLSQELALLIKTIYLLDYLFHSFAQQICFRSSAAMLKFCRINGSLLSHYNDVWMNAMASQTTSIKNAYSNVYSGANKRKHQSSASLAFVRRIHRWPLNSPHKGKTFHLMTLSRGQSVHITNASKAIGGFRNRYRFLIISYQMPKLYFYSNDKLPPVMPYK